MMENKEKWLESRLKYLGITKVEFAQRFDMQKQHVNRLETVKPKLSPSQFEVLSRILRCDNIALQNFWEGRINAEELWNTNMITNTLDQIMRVGFVQAGAWNEACQLPEDEWEGISYNISDTLKGKRIFALGVRGSSMNKKFPPETTTLICCDINDFGKDPEDGDYIIAYRKKAGLCEATVKRFYKISEDEFLLRAESDDPTFFDITIKRDGSEYEIGAIVIDYQIRLKNI